MSGVAEHHRVCLLVASGYWIFLQEEDKQNNYTQDKQEQQRAICKEKTGRTPLNQENTCESLGIGVGRKNTVATKTLLSCKIWFVLQDQHNSCIRDKQEQQRSTCTDRES